MMSGLRMTWNAATIETEFLLSYLPKDLRHIVLQYAVLAKIKRGKKAVRPCT